MGGRAQPGGMRHTEGGVRCAGGGAEGEGVDGAARAPGAEAREEAVAEDVVAGERAVGCGARLGAVIASTATGLAGCAAGLCNTTAAGACAGGCCESFHRAAGASAGKEGLAVGGCAGGLSAGAGSVL